MPGCLRKNIRTAREGQRGGGKPVSGRWVWTVGSAASLDPKAIKTMSFPESVHG